MMSVKVSQVQVCVRSCLDFKNSVLLGSSSVSGGHNLSIWNAGCTRAAHCLFCTFLSHDFQTISESFYVIFGAVSGDFFKLNNETKREQKGLL